MTSKLKLTLKIDNDDQENMFEKKLGNIQLEDRNNIQKKAKRIKDWSILKKQTKKMGSDEKKLDLHLQEHWREDGLASV